MVEWLRIGVTGAAMMAVWVGCFSSPDRPTTDAGGADARTTDGAVEDARGMDAAYDAMTAWDASAVDAPAADASMSADAPVADATAVDAPMVDAAPPDAIEIDAIPPDAAIPGTGMTFPPAAASLNITGGWAGDINNDGAEDVVLLNDTGDSGTAGVYVLFGRSGAMLGAYHQELLTGERAPLAAVATQADGTGSLDLLVYAVDFNTPDNFDNEMYLHQYAGAGAGFVASPTVNWVSEGTNMSWHGPFQPGGLVDMTVAKMAPGMPVTVLVVHARGGVRLALPSVGGSFENAAAQVLVSEHSAGVRAVPSLTMSQVDDLIVWSDNTGSMKWLKNDGAGVLTDTAVNGEPRGPYFAELYDMDGVPPLDVVGVVSTEIQAVPVDNDPKTTSYELNGQSYLTGIGNATDILVFDSNAGGGGAPEIVFAAPSCAPVADAPCLYMIRNAYLNGSNGELNGTASDRQWALPGGFVPRVMFRGDFDGDGSVEVVVFAADGSMACVRIDDEQFSACT